jgi:REP element-mobilizing transposase RayT
MDAYVHRINCVEDHIHILVGLPSTLSISQFVQRFKLSSGNWLREQPLFPQFDRWQAKRQPGIALRDGTGLSKCNPFGIKCDPCVWD